MERVSQGWLITERWLAGVVQSTEAGSFERDQKLCSVISTTENLVILST